MTCPREYSMPSQLQLPPLPISSSFLSYTSTAAPRAHRAPTEPTAHLPSGDVRELSPAHSRKLTTVIVSGRAYPLWI